jgi:hypothetical protein
MALELKSAMRFCIFLSLFALLSTFALAQSSGSDSVRDAQAGFQRILAQKGQKAAFLEILADDAVIFQPDAVNGKQYWTSMKAEP